MKHDYMKHDYIYCYGCHHYPSLCSIHNRPKTHEYLVYFSDGHTSNVSGTSVENVMSMFKDTNRRIFKVFQLVATVETVQKVNYV